MNAHLGAAVGATPKPQAARRPDLKAISLFSGVGGFELGFDRACIRTVLQAERDPWALGVLAHHWPEVERVNDVGAVSISNERLWCRSRGVGAAADGEQRSPVEPDHGGIALVYGGFPCQDLSVAGKRAGLAGERSGLWFEFHRVLSELRPAWAVIENVPGLLSSNQGRDFAVILDGLVELGYGVSWRILDAQHFGVPQRRRRVYVVGCLGDAARAGAVLAVCEGCGGDSAPRLSAREGTTGSLSAGTLRAGGVNGGNNPGGGYLADVAETLRSHPRPGSNSLGNMTVANAVAASAGHHGHSSPRGDGSDNLVTAIRTANTGANGHGIAEGVAHTLDGANGQAVLANPLGSNSTGGFRFDLDHDTYIPDIVGALSDGAHHGGGLNGQDAHTGRIFAPSAGVRRLTPLECERLMGWPDDHTRWAVKDGRVVEVPDSHRYRMAGNGVVANVAEWIGRRLVAASLRAQPPCGNVAEPGAAVTGGSL